MEAIRRERQSAINLESEADLRRRDELLRLKQKQAIVLRTQVNEKIQKMIWLTSLKIKSTSKSKKDVWQFEAIYWFPCQMQHGSHLQNASTSVYNWGNFRLPSAATAARKAKIHLNSRENLIIVQAICLLVSCFRVELWRFRGEIEGGSAFGWSKNAKKQVFGH